MHFGVRVGPQTGSAQGRTLDVHVRALLRPLRAPAAGKDRPHAHRGEAGEGSGDTLLHLPQRPRRARRGSLLVEKQRETDV